MATGTFKHKLTYDWKLSNELADKVCEEMGELCAALSEENDGHKVSVREIERVECHHRLNMPYLHVINGKGITTDNDSLLVFTEVLLEPYGRSRSGVGAWGYAQLTFPFARIPTDSSTYMVFMLKLLETV